MRALVITVTAGNGHNATAETLAESLTANGAEATCLDLYQYISRVLYNMVDKGYLFSIKHTPKGFGRAYSGLEHRKVPRKILGTLNSNRIIASRLASFFQDYQPDVIVVTHVFAAQVLDVLKRQGHLQVPIVGVMTDYCIHPFWETVPSVETIVIPSELQRYAAVRRGIEPERLVPLGIPVASKFSNRRGKEEARRELGLDTDKTTILVMGGSMGHGDLLQSVAEIDRMNKGYQVACITGANERLLEQLQKLHTRHPIHVCGFTNQVDLYMDAADCIVTKPGGLSTSEALSKELPLILVSPIPGQEERNAHFFVNSGAAVLVNRNFPVTEAVYTVLEREGRLEHMKQAIRHIACPRAATDIAELAIRMGKAHAKTAVVC